MRTNSPLSRCLKFLGTFALIAVAIGLNANIALAQTGADAASGPNAVFQLEGNTSTDGYVCFGITSTGPIIADGVAPGGGAPTCPSGTNLVTYAVPPTEDWDKIYSGKTVANATTGIVNDLFNSGSDDIYTGGSTKDTNDFGQWLWKNGKPQSKDDFEHGYAAAYARASDGHIIIVAGVDRYDNSGSSTAGFWFVQDPNVGTGVTTPTACTISSGCPFGGNHTDGDFLIISQFTVGGAVSTIQVFTWNGGASGSLNSTPNESGVQCDPRSGNEALCGTVNGVPVLSGGWAFTAKHAVGCNVSGTGSGSVTANCMDTGEFLEVGLDLTGLFQGLGKPVPCISRFFAESRSSGTGLSSTLSDFIKPVNFPLCGISDTKTCTGAQIVNGNSVQYFFNGQINNTGIGTLSSVTVADTPGPLPTGDTVSNLVVCEPALTDALGNNSCTANSVTAETLTAKGTTGAMTTYNGSFIGNFDSSSIDNVATVSGTTPEGDVLTHSASWLVKGSSGCAPAIAGTLAITKSCSTGTGAVLSGSPLAVQVTYSGTVTNNANVTVSNIAITDTPPADASSVSAITITCVSGCSNPTNGSLTLAAGGSATYSGTFDTSTCTPVATGRCQFSDSVTASGTGALGGGTLSAPAFTATCLLCPFGSCPTQ